jgi:hypothetical protein
MGEHKAKTVQCKNWCNIQGNAFKETEDLRCAVHVCYFPRGLYVIFTSN